MRIRVMAVVVGLLAAVLVISVAGAAFPAQSIGQGSSDVWVMNLDGTNDANVVASYVDQGGEPDASVGATLDPMGNSSFPASSSGLGNDWLGSMVLYSDRQLASVAQLYWQSVPKGDGWSGAGYSGYSEGANDIFFPGVAKTPSHRTLVTVQCVDTTDCGVNMTYRDSTGAVISGSPFVDTIEPDSQETYDLWDATLNPNIPTGLPTTWMGSLQVTSTNDIAGVMVVHWAVGYAAGYNALSPDDAGTQIYFPAVNRRNFGDWKGQSDWQGLTVQNLHDYSVDIYLSFYAATGGAPVYTLSDSIPAYSSKGYNTRYQGSWPFDTALGDSYLGSAIVTSTDTIAGVSGLVRYPSAGLAGGYNATPIAGTTQVFPVMYRIQSGAKWLGYSALGLLNADPDNSADVTIKFLNSDGSDGVTINSTLAAGATGAWTSKSTSLSGLGTNWAGPVLVTTTNSNGVLGVVTNHVAGTGYIYLASGNMIALE